MATANLCIIATYLLIILVLTDHVGLVCLHCGGGIRL